MAMNKNENIMYGGFEGSESEICENSRSLGELVLRKFQENSSKVILVCLITLS